MINSVNGLKQNTRMKKMAKSKYIKVITYTAVGSAKYGQLIAK